MRGETDLARLLATLEPVLDPTEWGFGTLPPGATLPPGLGEIGTFAEAEGLSVVAPLVALRAAGIRCEGPFAKISLTVHSALEAVGLTAALSAALTAEGISANVVAAFHHDHVFVQWGRREDAMAALARLARG
jgi:hypothetical protein